MDALRNSIIVPLDDGYKFVGQHKQVDSETAPILKQSANPHYKFQHDRV